MINFHLPLGTTEREVNRVWQLNILNSLFFFSYASFVTFN